MPEIQPVGWGDRCLCPHRLPLGRRVLSCCSYREGCCQDPWMGALSQPQWLPARAPWPPTTPEGIGRGSKESRAHALHRKVQARARRRCRRAPPARFCPGHGNLIASPRRLPLLVVVVGELLAPVVGKLLPQLLLLDSVQSSPPLVASPRRLPSLRMLP